MTRKKLKKLMMSKGIHRNATNFLLKECTSVEMAKQIFASATVAQITNCIQVSGGHMFKLKLRPEKIFKADVVRSGDA